MIVDRIGLMATPWIGALVVLGAFLLTTLAGRLDRRDAARGIAAPVPAEPAVLTH
jgi:predicted MFS family arabinose efflux permease